MDGMVRLAEDHIIVLVKCCYFQFILAHIFLLHCIKLCTYEYMEGIFNYRRVMKNQLFLQTVCRQSGREFITAQCIGFNLTYDKGYVTSIS